MRKISEKLRRFVRKFLQILGISGTALVFQAGYSQPDADIINGTVHSSVTNEPLSNIKVTVRPDRPGKKTVYESVTDENGNFYYHLPGSNRSMIYIIDFEDTDGEENGGNFQDKRVLHHIRDGRIIEVKLDEK